MNLRDAMRETVRSLNRAGCCRLMRDDAGGEDKAKMLRSSPMPPKSCRVSFTDDDGVEHGVEVMAESLYEAAALGLGLLKTTAWVSKEPAPLTRLRVEVREPPVQHSLTIQQLKRWADRTPLSPAERIKKERLKALLA